MENISRKRRKAARREKRAARAAAKQAAEEAVRQAELLSGAWVILGALLAVLPLLLCADVCLPD